MMKYMILLLPLLLMGCANTVEVREVAQYKCGEQIITTKILNDDSVIMTINNTDNVLIPVASPTGQKYSNVTEQIYFWQTGGNVYLRIRERDYPLCQQIVQ